MGALLIGEWLEGRDPIEVVDDASLALVRARVGAVAGEVGLDATVAARLTLAASELGTNQLRHAGSGAIVVRAIERLGVRGVEVIAADGGTGIADVAAAVRGPAPGATPVPGASLGVGLGAVLRNADEVDLDTRAGQGLCVRARAFAQPVSRSDVAVIGRPIASERVSGDHAVVVRTPARCTIAVFDGLGHGSPALEASNRAAAVVRARAADAPDAILRAVDEALRGTRGAVGAVAVVDYARRELTWASAGNIAGIVCGAGARTQLGGPGRVLGAPGAPARLGSETVAFGVRQILCVFSDGLTSRAVADDDPARLREHPAILAQHLADAYGRTSDDLIVVVAR